MSEQINCQKCQFIGTPIIGVLYNQRIVPWHYEIVPTEGGDYLSSLDDATTPCNGSQAPGR